MKKILTISLLGAMAFAGLPGQAWGQSDPTQLDKNATLAEKMEAISLQQPIKGVTGAKKFKSSGTLNRESNPVLKARKVGTRADEETPTIEGKWVFAMGDFYNEDATGEEFWAYFDATVIDGTVIFDNVMGIDGIATYDTPLMAYYDEETQILTFTRRYVGSTTLSLYEFYIYQVPFVYNDDLDQPEYRDVTAKFRPEDGGWLQFDDLMSIEWSVYVSQDGDEYGYLGAFDVFEIEDCFKADFPERDESSIWIDKGMATLVDGWVLPGLGIDQNLPENQYEVPLQQYIHDPNYYRLVNPYRYGPAAPYNESHRDGVIMFDITDPDMVLINPYGYEAGFANKDLGISRFFTYDQAVYYFLRYELPPLNTYEIFPELPRTVLKDGVIELGTGQINAGTVNNPVITTIYDANYGKTDRYYGGLAWYNADGKAADMTARIILPEGYNAIEGIHDDYQGPTKYYNLQGREVKNPKAGEIVIKVEGNKAKKILTR